MLRACSQGIQEATTTTLRNVMARMDAGTGSDIDRLLTDTLARGAYQNAGAIWKGDQQLKSAVGENISGYIGINDYGFKGKRQYIADRRYLLDLYVVAYNNADIRTAITHQRNEVFRRGMEWKPKWDFRCPVDGKEYSATEAKRNKGKCQHERDVHGEKKHIEVGLETPDERQKVEFDKFMDTCNYFGQSLETVLREIWDDINVVDDAFIFVSKEYFAHIDDNDEIQLTAQPKYIFRLDPVLVEFDLDQRGIPGMRHHVCLIHRDELLEVPPGEGWEIEWKGVCPQDKLPTYPVLNSTATMMESRAVILEYHEGTDEETEFLTKSGWKFGRDLTYEDAVATRTEKGVMQWQRPSKLFSTDYDGEMIQIEGRFVNLLITPNHRLLVKNGHQEGGGWFQLERVDEAAQRWGFKVPSTAIWAEIRDTEWFTLPCWKTVGSKRHGEEFPERRVKMDDWLEFFGYYLADGRSTGQTWIAQERDGKARDGITTVLERLGFDFREDAKGLYLREPQVLHYLRPLGESHEKYAPAEFKNLSHRQLKILVEAYLAGDGGAHPTNAGNGYFASTSKVLAEDMAEIMIKLGYAVSFRLKEFDNPNWKPQTFVHYHRKITESIVRQKNISRVHYTGKVYGAQVPNGTLCLRRRGKVTWTGSSYLPALGRTQPSYDGRGTCG